MPLTGNGSQVYNSQNFDLQTVPSSLLQLRSVRGSLLLSLRRSWMLAAMEQIWNVTADKHKKEQR